MKEKPKRKGKPAPRYLFWLMGAVAVVWGIALLWGYVSYGTATKTIISTMSFEESVTLTAQNFVMLGTDVPYCDYAAEMYVSSPLTEEDLTAAMLTVTGIEAATITYNQGDCFIRPESGERAPILDRYVRSQVIEITATIENSDLARGNMIYAVFNALMPLDVDERTVVRLTFVDAAGNGIGGWGKYYLDGISAIETYDRATIWQQTR